MDNKIGSIDNDGNITSNDIGDFNNMTEPSGTIQETNSYDTTSYNSDFDSTTNSDEEFDVFGNSKPAKKRFSINKKLIVIPIAILLIIIMAIILFVQSSNKYTVKTKNLTIKVKETEEIEVSGKEKILSKLTYSSEDKKIAKVDDDGKITGVSIGTTTIYVGINGKKSNKITVKVETNKEELVLKETDITLSKDETYQLAVKNVLDDDIFSWSSNNENVATVDQEGLITGIHAGTATITVKESDGRSVSTKVTVTSDETLIENISLEAKTIAIGEKVALKPAIYPANGLSILTWKSSKENVVEIDEKGVITGISDGTATITVTTHNGKKATAKITVDKTLPASIKLNGCTGGVVIGTPVTLGIVYSPDTAKSTITWASSNTSIATVSNGKVTGKAVGTVKITATTKNGKTATCTLKVSPTAVSSLKASPTSVSLDQGATKTISLTFTPSTAKQYYTVSWKSSNKNIATVDSTGKITGVNPGTATITATAGGKSAKVSVTVNATAVTSIEMTGCQSTVEAGKVVTLTAKALPTTAKNATIKWASSDTNIATVSNGKVTTKKDGVVVITASTANGKTATCSMTVTKPSITSLLLSESSVSLKVNGSKKINATTNLNSTNFKKYYTMSWRSSNPDIVSVTPSSTNSLSATLKGLKKGGATIYATVGGRAVSMQVTVS